METKLDFIDFTFILSDNVSIKEHKCLNWIFLDTARKVCLKKEINSNGNTFVK